MFQFYECSDMWHLIRHSLVYLYSRSVDGTSPENLLRISVGLEDVNDLMHDIDAALRAAVL